MAEELSCLKRLKIDEVSFDSMVWGTSARQFGELWGTGVLHS
jgi:hypothetical protein